MQSCHMSTFSQLIMGYILVHYNFFNSIPFFMILNAPHLSIRGFKFCLDTKNNGAFPLDLPCHECLSVIVATQLQFNLKLMKNCKN